MPLWVNLSPFRRTGEYSYVYSSMSLKVKSSWRPSTEQGMGNIFINRQPLAMVEGLPTIDDFNNLDLEMTRKVIQVKVHDAVLLSRPWRTFVIGTCGLLCNGLAR